MAMSKLVAKEGQPMTWITPLGLPVLQPYRQKDKYQVPHRAAKKSCVVPVLVHALVVVLGILLSSLLLLMVLMRSYASSSCPS